MPLTPSKPILRFSLIFAMAATATAAVAQAYTPPPPALTAGPCVPTKKDPCTPVPTAPAAQPAFPFPGEPGATPPATPPTAPGAQPSFPFPGEPTAAPAPAPAEPSSSSSSSSSAADPDDVPAPAKDQPAGSTRFARKHLPKVQDVDGREAEDIEVSKYYTSTGNFQAAYLRARDAVATIPDDPEAHFRLAQTAEKLEKKDEAILEYATTIKLEPDGLHVKAASQALAALSTAKTKH